jgi:ankyrin repeat protein
LGADVNVRDDCRFTLLHLAASHNSVEVLEYLISQGIDVNALDGFRRTVLYYAGVFNNAEVMQYLISQGADVHVKFGTGATVLQNCCDPMDFHGKEDVAKKKRIVREAMER